MQIDWFTVLAQAINFIVLMWLLKRFLYKPILNAIAVREKEIADILADANAKEAKAKKEQAEFQKKNEEFEAQKTKMVNDAKKTAKEAGNELIEKAKTDAEAMRAKSKEALKNEAEKSNQEIIDHTKQEIFAITAKALHDLADAGLEEQVITVFIKQLENLAPKEKKAIAAAFKDASPATISSAFALHAAQKTAIKTAITENLGVEVSEENLHFKTTHKLIAGIELSLSGYRLGWNIKDYLATLEKSVADAK